MSTSLLALLDDIATVLDDVASMTKVAAGRTAGVLGDDLALNAEQVSGIRADREIPVVWAVFKGSAWNKTILVPLALLLAAFAPFLIQPLLIFGGCFLCFEGFEKVFLKFFHPEKEADAAAKIVSAFHNADINLVEFEREKIKGAIRTDFILSAEIIVISMGTIQEAAFVTQVFTVITMAVLMTVGVYGLVAGIVKLDDAGLHLAQTANENKFKAWTGSRILSFAPYLMKGLSIIGTLAMFLVGGGIILHGIPPLSHMLDLLTAPVEFLTMGPMLVVLINLTANASTGVLSGAFFVGLFSLVGWLKTKYGQH